MNVLPAITIEKIRELLDKGVSISETSRTLQVSIVTVRKYAHEATAAEIVARHKKASDTYKNKRIVVLLARVKKYRAERNQFKNELDKLELKYSMLNREHEDLKNKIALNKPAIIIKRNNHDYTAKEDEYILTDKATIKAKAKVIGVSYMSLYARYTLLKNRIKKHHKKLTTKNTNVICANSNAKQVITKQTIDKKIKISYIDEILKPFELCSASCSLCENCMFKKYCNESYRIFLRENLIAENYKTKVKESVVIGK
jgi:hypothetical protein